MEWLFVSFALGLRHASDPDHLVAVTSLVATDAGDAKGAARLGAWWGLGHGGTLLAIGVPLIALKSELPAWLKTGAEKAVGLVILALAVRVIWMWLHGGRADRRPALRTCRQAIALGGLHGLAGTGAVVLLVIAARPDQTQAIAALAVFAPMSAVSMTAWTGAFAWTLTRPRIEPVYQAVLIPMLGLAGVLFGLWYAGLA